MFCCLFVVVVVVFLCMLLLLLFVVVVVLYVNDFYSLFWGGWGYNLQEHTHVPCLTVMSHSSCCSSSCCLSKALVDAGLTFFSV